MTDRHRREPNNTMLDLELDILKKDIRSAKSSLLYTPSQEVWDEVFDKINKIQESFKTVVYPSRDLRENAWNIFCDLRNKAYEQKRHWNTVQSFSHMEDILQMLDRAMYSAVGAFIVEIVTIGFLKTSKEEMFELQKKLNEAIQYYNEVKQFMHKPQREKVRKKIDEVRQSHNDFWERYREASNQLNVQYAEKQARWKEQMNENKEKARANLDKNITQLEVALDKKEKIEANITKNEENLEKAREALSRFENKRDELQEKIDDSSNNNWIEKAEGWLEEHENKIKNIEEQIERLEGWIEEGEIQLNKQQDYIARIEEWIRQSREKYDKYD